MKKPLILLSILLLAALSFARMPQNKRIDPTGTYLLDAQQVVIDREPYGDSGLIQVVSLPGNKIFMTFIFNKGAPSYSRGSFTDTLNYVNNRAVYKNPAADTTCEITFTFTDAGITVKEKTTHQNSGCGFGKGIVADGFYKKVSSTKPVLKNPRTGETIK